MKVLSIDVGIKNFAYCLLESREDKTFDILQWDVLNLCGEEPKCQCERDDICESVKISVRERQCTENQSVHQYEKDNVQRTNPNTSARGQHKQNQPKCQYEGGNIGRISQDVSTSDAM